MKLQVLFMLLIALVTFIYKRDQALRYGHGEMCKKLKTHFVEKITEQDFEQCLEIYESVLTFKDWELKTNSWLGSWGWSHLSVYSPSESEEIWESKTQNIGVRLKQIENKFVVYEAHPESDFKKGDLILLVKGEEPLYEMDILYEEGVLKIVRKGKELEIKASVKDFLWDDQVELIGNILKIPSFRGEFFEDEDLVHMQKELSQVKDAEIILDLRDNYGGNVASALRLMSLFFCEETRLGSFRTPSREHLGSSNYPLSVGQEEQVAHMKKFGEVHLKTFAHSDCIGKKVKVLVNGLTSSTAELVAQSFIDLKRGLVVGEKTSGRMVLSSWEQISYFPEGFYFSHPYALYSSLSGADIEGRGVSPDIYKTYSLELEQKGLDSFLN